MFIEVQTTGIMTSKYLTKVRTYSVLYLIY